MIPCISRDGILLNEIGTSYKITIFIANHLMCNTTQLITIFRLNIHIKTSNKYEFVGILKHVVLRYRNVKGVYRWISKKQYCFGGITIKLCIVILMVNDKNGKNVMWIYE